jgi:hypothetical protein
LSGSTTDVRWSLQAPDGSTVFDAFFIDQEVTLALTGAYRLEVRGQGADGSGAYSFSLQAAPANRAPVAEDDAVETEHGAVVRIDVLANDSDPDGDELTLEGVTEPAHGTAAIDGDRVTYAPEAGFAGTDSFTYTLTAGRGGSAGATVTVTVQDPPNRPPSITEIADRQNTVGDRVALQVEAEDADGDALEYAAAGLPPGLRIDSQSGLIAPTGPPQTTKAPTCGAFAQCAEEDSNLHPVIPDQALNLVTRVSYPSGSCQIVRLVRRRG